MSSWDDSNQWYHSCVGEKGHYYHQSVILPHLIHTLSSSQTATSLLDLGCGQGVLARHLPNKISYWGCDLSPQLIEQAKKATQPFSGHFLIADATHPLPIEKVDFDWVVCLLSIQNMENPEGAIRTASHHLRPGGKFLIVLNHPCFRIPRQTSWGIDEKAKLQYRKIHAYLSPQKIPIQMNPGKQHTTTTYSYHFPLSTYMQWLKNHHFSVLDMQEWVSPKKSQGSKAGMEDRARKEIPLFLYLIAERREINNKKA